MPGPASISVRQISAAAKTSVAKVLEQQKPPFQKPKFEIGFVPPWWWIGIIIRSPEFDQTTFSTAQKLAKDIHRGIGASVPAAKAGKPGAAIKDGTITIGFYPPKEIELIHE
jgi:hypothetical protein